MAQIGFFLVAVFACLVPASHGNIDCSNSTSIACQPDSLKYCLTDGRIILGTCEVTSLVCEYDAVIDESFAACDTTEEEVFNCTGYMPGGSCLPDSVPYCLSNGQVVLGSCDAKIQVCENGLSVDVSGNACKETDPFDCANFDPSEVCRPDLVTYCLTSGEEVQGLCQTKKAICGDGKTLDPSGDACKDDDDDENTAATMSGSFILLLTAFWSTWYFN